MFNYTGRPKSKKAKKGKAEGEEKARKSSYQLPWGYCQCGCKGCTAKSEEPDGPVFWLRFEFVSALTLKSVTLRTAHPPQGIEISSYPTLEAADLAARQYKAPAEEPKQKERVPAYA